MSIRGLLYFPPERGEGFSALAGGGIFLPRKGEALLALTGGELEVAPAGAGAWCRPDGRGGQQPFGGWSNAPPISSEEIPLCFVPA